MVNAEEIERLMSLVEAEPDTEITVDLEDRKLHYKGQDLPFDIPDSHHNALTTGSWDSTSLLLENTDQVKKTARNLPYTSNFEAPAAL
jgi:3-isopropylmalate/(R)-2-methylmalate dehydratase small subunit